jgi:hypothetical protein
MKIDRLETHDRLLHLQNDQGANLSQGAHDCLTKNPLSLALQAKSHYIYIFAHPRTADDGVNKRMLWQPRLGRPKAQTNSYLFRAKSNTDILEICWMLPPEEMWAQYRRGNVTASEYVMWSIDMFINNKKALEMPLSDDMNDEQIKHIYLEVATEMDQEKRMKGMYGQKTEDNSRSSSLILPS